MQFLAHLVSASVSWVAIPVLVAAGLLVPAILRRLGWWKRGALGCGVASLVMAVLWVVVIGTWVRTGVIHRFGGPGEGVVTEQFATGSVHNDEPVVGFRALIRPAGREARRTVFHSNDFNVWPPANSVRYPPVGVRFNVRVLPDYPGEFVILTDDDSPFARGLRCEALLGQLARATSERRFAGVGTGFDETVEAALAEARAGGCIPSEPPGG